MPQPLAVVVRAKDSQAPLARERVSPADLSDAIAEAWRDQCLRRGFPELALAEVPMTLVPLLREGDVASRCNGFALDVELPDGKSHRQEFSLLSLASAASRAMESLATGGIPRTRPALFTTRSQWIRRLQNHRPTRPAPHLSRSTSGVCRPRVCACRSGRCCSRRRRWTSDDDNAFPVFFTVKALEKAEACSRAGAKSIPPVESGGVLVGSLAFCEAANEFFVIVTDVLEVNDAEQTTFSLSYSGQSWNRIQAIMKARQAAHPLRAERLTGPVPRT